jgi:hypothetical protein
LIRSTPFITLPYPFSPPIIQQLSIHNIAPSTCTDVTISVMLTLHHFFSFPSSPEFHRVVPLPQTCSTSECVSLSETIKPWLSLQKSVSEHHFLTAQSKSVSPITFAFSNFFFYSRALRNLQSHIYLCCLLFVCPSSSMKAKLCLWPSLAR